MTRQAMITGAHDQACHEARKFGISYRAAFRNALRGFRAVAAGFRGIDVKEPRRLWA